MAYRNKEACLAEAERLGINVSGMSWPDMQKAVSTALKREALGINKMEPYDEVPYDNLDVPRDYHDTSKLMKNWHPGQIQTGSGDLMNAYAGKTIFLSPELSPERYRLVKYDETLGNEIEVEERKFDMDRETDRVFDVTGDKVSYDNVVDEYHDYTTGTFRIKNRSDRKVIAMSSVPKENAGMYYRPGMDYATVVTWNGKSGYLWKHWRYPNVRALLKMAGDEYYQKYKGRFKDEPNVWYAAGKMLVCDPYLVHKTIEDIQNDARKKRIEEEARYKQMGIDSSKMHGGRQW